MARWLRRIKHALTVNKRADLLRALQAGSTVLDVGCGNDAAFHAKNINPNIVYEGVDVGDYNILHKDAFDVYTIVQSEDFALTLENMDKEYDLVISNHNLEHCLYPYRMIDAMCARIKPGGLLYLAFPNEDSIGFPCRAGSLNFYDDCTHKWLPRGHLVVDRVRDNGLSMIESHIPFRPRTEYWMGWVMEPWSSLTQKTMAGTWAYWGFENVLLAQRPV
ncbi:putative Methyl transferase type 11 (plasmid) [Pseudodesulfovibrio profundus]|uniref:Putative Methyl transferase type 11 n=1 Tax=Pseudodesulfovibrio profundus TaxID=57320 RepID=A0A2C8FEJ7_9BACT|nr:methyltransferase domain-containing protein [Pseudodesulfovibrio profundus]SOB62140.1 putative Methyl transferase type 11 [Pseudodesulfovibrio profundus]